jgi:hypothetical protein
VIRREKTILNFVPFWVDRGLGWDGRPYSWSEKREDRLRFTFWKCHDWF